jgi:hypothetical protein
VAPLATSCGVQQIPNTTVPDTRENRAVIDVAERYRHAVEARDTRALLALASPNYFEDAGTPQGDDDYGYEGLRRLLSIWTEEVQSVRYEIRYRHVTFEREGSHAVIDYTYTGSFTLRRPPAQLPDGVDAPQGSLLDVDPVRGATPVNADREVWYRRVADNRLEMEREGNEWRIVSGM